MDCDPFPEKNRVFPLTWYWSYTWVSNYQEPPENCRQVDRQPFWHKYIAANFSPLPAWTHKTGSNLRNALWLELGCQPLQSTPWRCPRSLCSCLSGQYCWLIADDGRHGNGRWAALQPSHNSEHVLSPNTNWRRVCYRCGGTWPASHQLCCCNKVLTRRKSLTGFN